jgi:putative transposase
MEKWNGKYRIPSARASWWDYGDNGIYFITICTENRKHFLGTCENGKLVLSTIGAIVQGFWYEIPRHFSFVKLETFIVMPNHIHGILIIDKPENSTIKPPIDKTPAQLRAGNQGKDTVSSILGSYKSVCTKHINKVFPQINFGWQDLFWDSIISDNDTFDIVANYIVVNPSKWKEDKFYTDDTQPY